MGACLSGRDFFFFKGRERRNKRKEMEGFIFFSFPVFSRENFLRAGALNLKGE